MKSIADKLLEIGELGTHPIVFLNNREFFSNVEKLAEQNNDRATELMNALNLIHRVVQYIGK